MNNLNAGQYKALSDFFNTIAAAWFSGGVTERWLYFTAGLGFSLPFLDFSLAAAREVG